MDMSQWAALAPNTTSVKQFVKQVLGQPPILEALTTGDLAALQTAAAVTLGVGATALSVSGRNAILLTGDAGKNGITSLTGGITGQLVLIEFVDALVNISTAAVAKLPNNTRFYASAGDVLLLYYDGSQYVCVGYSRNSLQTIATASPADPTGTTSATLVMMGLAVAFTPKVTGRVKITVTGMMGSSGVGSGASVQISHGTGAAPVNGAAVTGTQDGKLKNMVASTAAGKEGFAACAVVTGLSLDTAIWVDLALKRVTADTASLYDLDIIVEEF